MTRVAAMARGWIGPSSSSPPRKAVHRQCRSGATESLNILLALLIAVIAPALATVAGPPHLTTQKGPGGLIAKDDTPAGFPYALGSFNGLLIDQGEDEMGETSRLDLISRAPKDATVEPLENNKFEAHEISVGASQRWFFSVNSAASNSPNDARNDQSQNTKVYISVTICRQPIPKESISDIGQAPKPLEVYVSEKDNEQRKLQTFAEGHMSTSLLAKSDVYIDIHAPKSSDFIGSYSYQVAVSTDNFFHKFNDQVALHSDTGSTTALLYFTEEIAKVDTANYTLFIINADKSDLSGLSQSYCALERAGKIANVETSSTKNREQFSITGLNRSSNYMGVLATSNTTKSGNGIVGGGGTVWKAEPFKTKANGNCEIIHKLGFCSNTAQAVPYNPSMSLSETGISYDDNAENLYKNFTYSLQQIQCNTSSETNFSMAVNCSGCANAYKTWLCAVTIPECDDYNALNLEPNNGFLIRNIGQPFPNGTRITELLDTRLIKRSRIGFIDDTIKPGPYSEKLPNLTLCHDLVRQCPMALEFSCPDGDRAKYSYRVSTGLRFQVPYSLWSTMMAFSIVGTVLWPF